VRGSEGREEGESGHGAAAKAAGPERQTIVKALQPPGGGWEGGKGGDRL